MPCLQRSKTRRHLSAKWRPCRRVGNLAQVLKVMPLLLSISSANASSLPVHSVCIDKQLCEGVIPYEQSQSANIPQFRILHQNVMCWGTQVETWLQDSASEFDMVCLCERHLHSSLIPYTSKRLQRAGWFEVWRAASSSFGRVRPHNHRCCCPC